MENQIPFGIANSVSANLDFDPLDTLAFAKHHQFAHVQIFLKEEEVSNAGLKKALHSNNGDFQSLFFHAHGRLNMQFLQSRYAIKLRSFLEAIDQRRCILHFDEQVPVDEACTVVHKLSDQGFQIYLENYFDGEGQAQAEKNLKKYLALFTLLNSGKHLLWPVLDIARFFHPKLCFTQQQALTWCFQLFNYFSNRQQKILFHLIDLKEPSQERKRFCAVLEGVLPYREIFRFMHKNRIPMQSLIFEFEDKLNPLRSRDNISRFWQELSR
ncbi:MAG: hypothetical protein D6715_09850 [Calditrichaeota bacterium]|nr:MAG: hypothetical protein D6715_09850 [Calditrichota bacterium]